jgi:hypothetical protein
MIVHADDARDNRIATQVEDGDIGTLWPVCSRPNCDYPAVFDRDVLIGLRRGTRAVDDSHVLEDYFRRADAGVLAHLGAESIGGLPIPELGMPQGGHEAQGETLVLWKPAGPFAC